MFPFLFCKHQHVSNLPDLLLHCMTNSRVVVLKMIWMNFPTVCTFRYKLMVLAATMIENAPCKTCAFRMDNWLWTWNLHMQTAIERNLLCFWWNLFIIIFLYLAVLFAFGSMFCIWLNFIEFGWISLYLAKFLCILVYFIIVWPANFHGRRLALCSEQRWWWRQPKPVEFSFFVSCVWFLLYFVFDFLCILCLISCVYC